MSDDASTDPVRWGICGTGAIARAFVEGLTHVPDAEVAAVASRDGARGAAFADASGARVHVGTEALAADDDVDVVYVASTQDRHVDDVVTLVRAGRNVLCEKPFALSLADAEQMCAAAGDAHVFLMEALWSRFLPSYVRLAELLDDEVIGRPQLVEANFSISVPVAARADHRLYDPHRGGGALLDLGVYPVQLAHLVFGAPTTVSATADLTDRGVDAQTALVLGWADGGAALLHTAIGTNGTCGARITGTAGTIELAPFMHCTTELTITTDDGVEVETFADPSLHFQVPEVHRCLRGGLFESSVMPHAETLAIMATLDTALPRSPCGTRRLTASPRRCCDRSAGDVELEGGAAPAVGQVPTLDGHAGDVVGNLDAGQRSGEGLFVGVIVGEDPHAELGAVGSEHPPRVGVAFGRVVGRADGHVEAPGPVRRLFRDRIDDVGVPLLVDGIGFGIGLGVVDRGSVWCGRGLAGLVVASEVASTSSSDAHRRRRPPTRTMRPGGGAWSALGDGWWTERRLGSSASPDPRAPGRLIEVAGPIGDGRQVLAQLGADVSGASIRRLRADREHGVIDVL